MRRRPYLLGLAAALTLLSGCSVLSTGAVVGTNAGRGREVVLPGAVSGIAPGTPVRLALRDGTAARGAFVSADSAGTLRLRTARGVLEYPVASVRQVERPGTRYPVLPAFLVGLGIDALLVGVVVLGGGLGTGVGVGFGPL